MNKKSLWKTLPAAFMPAFFLLVSLLGSEGTLLCFGKDGHVAIEFVNECNGSGNGSQQFGSEGDACGPCNDIRFLSSPAHTNNVSDCRQTFPLLYRSPISVFSTPDKYPGSNINMQGHLDNKQLAGLHSVVLLI